MSQLLTDIAPIHNYLDYTYKNGEVKKCEIILMKVHRSIFFVHNLAKHDIQKLRPVTQAQTDTKIHPRNCCK